MCQITPVKTFIRLTWEVFQSILISARFAFSVLVSTVFSPVNRAFNFFVSSETTNLAGFMDWRSVLSFKTQT